ncbi:hypothetical protein [uncultured Cohaesibacter sp.]|uniref:hypothetical protein n=1 Tax=uncultured Cohaesibacter sp. TaxID=1002546 RepID=UPI0029C75C53|nr:hypothetical protein [uncultured Cohaesibacter sp.]
MKHKEPMTVVVNLPISRAIGDKRPTFLPSLIIRDKGVYKDALQFADEFSLAYSVKAIETRIKTIARFMNFWDLFIEGVDISIEEQSNAIFTYVDFRIHGTEELDELHPLSELHWKPIQKEHARNEFKYIIEFFDFLEKNSIIYDEIPIFNRLNISFHNKNGSRYENYKKFKQPDLLFHLKKSRDFWKGIRGENYHLPDWLRPASTKSTSRPYPDFEEVRDLILLEKNVTFRAIWIALAFGSHRVSEVLHAWQCDVLPARNRARFFGHSDPKNNQIAFIMAHPSESTYIDAPSARGQTRERYLSARYGMLPRNLLPSTHKNRLGWKSKLLLGSMKTTDTFWLNPNAASLFEDCIREIQKFHLANQTSKSHPYLFVNTRARGDNFAQPLKYARAADALDAAFRRIGVSPKENGRNLHGLRHFSKDYMENVLGLSPREIQVIRGDMSINSQDDYGKNITKIHEVMKSKNHTNIF